jgi:hypothetical protein
MSSLLLAIIAALLVPVLYGVVQGLRGKPSPKRVPLAAAIKAGYEPGGFFYERNEAVRPFMQRHGLAFAYWNYRPPDGSSVVFFPNRVLHLGGPFQLLGTPLTEVYEGSFPGGRVVTGHHIAGDIDNREERMVAIFTVPGLAVPTFTARTHHVAGDAQARSFLSGGALDWLTGRPGFALEGKDDKLLIVRVEPPRDPSGYLTADEMTAFVDEAFRAARLLGVPIAPVAT